MLSVHDLMPIFVKFKTKFINLGPGKTGSNNITKRCFEKYKFWKKSEHVFSFGAILNIKKLTNFYEIPFLSLNLDKKINFILRITVLNVKKSNNTYFNS